MIGHQDNEREAADACPPVLSVDELRKEVPNRGLGNLLKSSLSALGGITLSGSITGGVITLFQIGALVSGLVLTGIIVFPALFVAGLLAYREYRAAQSENEKEKEAINTYNANIAELREQAESIHDNINYLLEKLKAKNNITNKDEALEILGLLRAIDLIRKLTGKEDYKELSYHKWKGEYNRFVETQEINDPHLPIYNPLPKEERPTGFFKTIWHGTKKFFSDLNDHRKTVAGQKGGGFYGNLVGTIYATGRFIHKAIFDQGLPFLSGFGLAISLGMTGLGLASIIGGFSASLTGIGAVGGVPVLAIGAMILVGAAVFGLATAAFNFFIKQRQEENKQNAINDNKELLVEKKAIETLSHTVKDEKFASLNSHAELLIAQKAESDAKLQRKQEKLDNKKEMLEHKQEKMDRKKERLKMLAEDKYSPNAMKELVRQQNEIDKVPSGEKQDPSEKNTPPASPKPTPASDKDKNQ